MSGANVADPSRGEASAARLCEAVLRGERREAELCSELVAMSNISPRVGRSRFGRRRNRGPQGRASRRHPLRRELLDGARSSFRWRRPAFSLPDGHQNARMSAVRVPSGTWRPRNAPTGRFAGLSGEKAVAEVQVARALPLPVGIVADQLAPPLRLRPTQPGSRAERHPGAGFGAKGLLI